MIKKWHAPLVRVIFFMLLMKTAALINLYQSYSDRGAFVQEGLWQTTEVDESDIKVGEKLPGWPSYDGPVVMEFVPGEHLTLMHYELVYDDKSFNWVRRDKEILIVQGEEVFIDSSLFSENYGVSCYILQCVKLL